MSDATRPPSPAPLFSLSIDPRARLLLFDIADDPHYVAMEVQAFDDEIHGQGLLVLLARHDGIVDIYRQPSLRLERGPFSIGAGIGEWREATIEPARLAIEDDGVDVEVGLTDADGRRIEVRIDDRDGSRRRRATLLAPVGSGVRAPGQFFVVLMREFDLGRTSGQEPRISIAGEARSVTPFPGPAWLHRRRFIRYSADPVIANLNPAHDGPVDPGSLGPIERVDASAGAKTAALRFAPAVPDLRALAADDEASGTWALDVADEPDLTGGTWAATRSGDAVTLSMAVTRPWRPRRLPWSLRLVTTVARVFRDWPTTYRWSATVDLGSATPTLHAGWARTTGPDVTNAYGVRRLPGVAIVGAIGSALLAVGLVVTRWRRRVARR